MSYMQLSSLPLPQWRARMGGYSPHAPAHVLTQPPGLAMLSPEDSAWESSPQPLFSARSAGPTVQRLVLGGHLRRLREEAGMTTEQAAASIRGSHSKISRMEHGRVGFKERDIA